MAYQFEDTPAARTEMGLQVTPTPIGTLPRAAPKIPERVCWSLVEALLTLLPVES